MVSENESDVSKKERLESRVIKTKEINWKELKFIQQDDFKELNQEAHDKLKASILSNRFTQPFYVWEEPETRIKYCLDGRHRVIILEELVSAGHEIPKLLPATFIQCSDKNEAARLVLVYSSIYAKITQQGLFDFIKEYDLDYAEIKETIDIPEFSEARYEQKFDVYNTSNDLDEYEVDAGEKTGRAVYGLEIEPGHIQTIIKRYILYCEKNDQEVKFTHLNGSLTLNDFTHGKNQRSGKNKAVPGGKNSRSKREVKAV